MKKLLVLFNLIIFLLSCSKNTVNQSTFNIDFSAVFGSTNADIISSNSYLKITGSYGDIDGKYDVITGATTPTGIPKLYSKYVGHNGNLLNNKIELGFGEFLLFGATDIDRYSHNGISGSGYAQRSVDTISGPIINGTGITKDDNGIITIKFAHAPGNTVYPYLFMIKTDTNGIFRIGQGLDDFKRSKGVISNDINFDDVDLIVDKHKSGLSYWVGDLQAIYENNILTIKGSLVETNN